MSANFVTVKLDLRNLDDAPIDAGQIREICVIYDNIGEGAEYEESVPFQIKSMSKS